MSCIPEKFYKYKLFGQCATCGEPECPLWASYRLTITKNARIYDYDDFVFYSCTDDLPSKTSRKEADELIDRSFVEEGFECSVVMSYVKIEPKKQETESKFVDEDTCIDDQDEYEWACYILEDLNFYPFVCECCDKDLMDWLGCEYKKMWDSTYM